MDTNETQANPEVSPILDQPVSSSEGIASPLQSEPLPVQVLEPVAVESPAPPSPEFSSSAPTGISSNSSTLNGPFPDELRGWNWGAFFLNWIWGIGNNTWIALLMFLPIANFVMPFVLGAKGNEWAWNNRKFDGVEHFRSVQKAWTRWAVILFVIPIALAVGLIIFSSLIPRRAATVETSPTPIVQPGTSVQTN